MHEHKVEFTIYADIINLVPANRRAEFVLTEVGDATQQMFKAIGDKPVGDVRIEISTRTLFKEQSA